MYSHSFTDHYHFMSIFIYILSNKMQSYSVFLAFSQTCHGTYHVLNTIKQPQTKYCCFFSQSFSFTIFKYAKIMFWIIFIVSYYFFSFLFLYVRAKRVCEHEEPCCPWIKLFILYFSIFDMISTNWNSQGLS